MPVSTADDEAGAVRTRDAVKTRRLLLEAARSRFALDGYGSTTVRDIAADAGVNVALINRYFTSKEGLFEACLAGAVEELDRTDAEPSSFDAMLRTLVQHVAGLPGREPPLQLLLLLRSSGDEAADRIRRDTLHSYTERIATMSGWDPADASTEHVLLHAQIALATAFGIVLMRASTGLEPLTSATEERLAAPLSEVVSTLLDPGRRAPA